MNIFGHPPLNEIGESSIKNHKNIAHLRSSPRLNIKIPFELSQGLLSVMIKII